MGKYNSNYLGLRHSRDTCPAGADVQNLNGSCTGTAIKCRHLNMMFGIVSITLHDIYT